MGGVMEVLMNLGAWIIVRDFIFKAQNQVAGTPKTPFTNLDDPIHMIRGDN
jgi:hypothetical protein